MGVARTSPIRQYTRLPSGARENFLGRPSFERYSCVQTAFTSV